MMSIGTSYVPILYRPFDIRQIYYVPWMIDWPMARDNAITCCWREHRHYCWVELGIVIGPGEWEIVFASRMMSDLNVFTFDGGNNVFPIYKASLRDKKSM